MNKWDIRFFSLALEVATWSKDPSSKVGCVAVSPGKRQFVTGYNGFPTNIPDTIEMLNDKAVKNDFMIHAEANCICNATQLLKGWTLYVTKAPCLNCAKLIAGSDMLQVYCPNPEGSWADEQIKAYSFLTTAGIKVDFYG